MSEHAWSQEHVAAYLTGGLTTAEVERLDAHARDCPACTAALDVAHRLDSGLGTLFAVTRPGPELEDRAVHRLRLGTPRTSVLTAWPRRAMVAAAAVAFLGTFGTMVGSVITGGRLPMPGEFAHGIAVESPRTLAPTQGWGGRRSPNRADVGGDPGELTNEDPGFQSNLEAALPELDRVDKQAVDVIVTKDNLGQPNAPNSDTTALVLPGGGNGGRKAATGPVTGVPWNAVNGGGLGGGGGIGGINGGIMGIGGGIGGIGGLPTSTTGSGVPFATYTNPYYLPSTHPVPAFRPRDLQPVPAPTVAVTQPSIPEPSSRPKSSIPGTPVPDPEPGLRRVVIRSGETEFEIESFDAATATVTKLVLALKGAFVATVNSEKLPNGKVKGSITVRTPPEHLDGLVLDLRKELGKGGELKGIRISSQDVTKQYTDLESRLRAARTMEQRLLQIIKEGKGEIKQLLEAEKELGIWRTRIEEVEGELRYYANLAALCSLTITLTEREIRAAAGLIESERVQAGVEVEDVDKSYQQILAAVLEAKGRITKSELKQLTAGQFNATLNFEVAPESAGRIRDRLRQLGRVARLEIDRLQQADGTVTRDAKVKQGDTVFLVQLYNLANVAPREIATLQVAVADVSKAYQALRDVVAKTTGRVLIAQINEQDRQNVSAQFDFEVRRVEEGIVRTALDAAGEVLSRQVTRAPEGDGVTDVKMMYRLTLFATSRLKPRETATLQVVAPDVPVAYQSLRDAVARATGRVVTAQLDENDRQNVTAQFDFEVRRTEEASVQTAFDSVGEVVARQVTRVPEGDNLTDARILYRATFLAANRLKPREITTLGIEVADVEQLAATFGTQVVEAKGRKVDAQLSRDRAGRLMAKMVYDVPLAAATGVLERFKASGAVRVYQSVRDPQAPGGKYAIARLNVTLSNAERIVAADEGVWPQVRRGLSYSVVVLLTSVTWLVFGLCMVLPWAVIAFISYRVIRWMVRSKRTPVAPPTVA